MKELVSIVVPVYNTKEYLEKCLRSILQQTYKNIEIIVVDDGSTDGSAVICDKLQLEDERITVIHKANGGVVSAREIGLERAKGEYVIAIDSDDWIEPNMLSELYDLASKNNADIVTSGYYRESEDMHARVFDDVKAGVYSSKEEKEYIYRNLLFCSDTEQSGVLPYIWNKLVRLSLLREVHLKLSEMIVFGEDAAVIYSCCTRAEKIIITHDIYYHYMMRKGSAIHRNHPYFCRSANELYIFLKKEFENNVYKSILLKQLDMYMIQLVFWGLNYSMGFSKDVTIPYYDFDKNEIEKGAKVVLYGAGHIGQAYYKQICADKLYQLVGWIDKNYLQYQEQGWNVSEVEAIEQWGYDYVILAFKYEDMAKEVKKILIERYGIEAEKLVWLKPISIIEKYRIKA